MNGEHDSRARTGNVIHEPALMSGAHIMKNAKCNVAELLRRVCMIVLDTVKVFY